MSQRTVPIQSADEILSVAIRAARLGNEERRALDAVDAPVYIADAEGRVTFFNRACAAFAGREPKLGEDRWCVTWRLFTLDGESLAHESCPMAVAIREQRPVRGMEAVAERPDGSRVRFLPFPTPVRSEEGDFLGAVNLLIDVTDTRQAEEYRDQAGRCRRLALSVNDAPTVEALKVMASDYEARARALTWH